MVDVLKKNNNSINLGNLRFGFTPTINNILTIQSNMATHHSNRVRSGPFTGLLHAGYLKLHTFNKLNTCTYSYYDIIMFVACYAFIVHDMRYN